MKPLPTIIIAIGIINTCLGWVDKNWIAFLLGVTMIVIGNYIFDEG